MGKGGSLRDGGDDAEQWTINTLLLSRVICQNKCIHNDFHENCYSYMHNLEYLLIKLQVRY